MCSDIVDSSVMLPVIFVTGSSKRIGAEIIRQAHSCNNSSLAYNVIIHYHRSESEAIALMNELNAIRPDSAKIIQADLTIINDDKMLSNFVSQVMSCYGRLDALVNNASRFYPTPIGQITHHQWNEIFLTNAKVPLFLSQAFFPYLRKTKGSIINILDIHANHKPFINYPIYNMAKSASQMMVQSLALELAPDVRVNGVAPGTNIFPDINTDQAISTKLQEKILSSIPLQRIGNPSDIANAVNYLLQANYVTGQIIAIDGGRSLTLKGT